MMTFLLWVICGQMRAIVVGPHAVQGVLEAFAARWRDVVGSPPKLHLGFAPLLARFILVEAGELAVIAFVQCGVAHDRDVRLIEFGKDDVEGMLSAFQNAGEGDVEFHPMIADHAAGDARFDQSLLGQVGIAPAREQVEPVPFALTVAHKNENVVCQRVCHVLVNAFASGAGIRCL